MNRNLSYLNYSFSSSSSEDDGSSGESDTEERNNKALASTNDLEFQSKSTKNQNIVLKLLNREVSNAILLL